MFRRSPPPQGEQLVHDSMDRARLEQTLFEVPKHLFLERTDLKLAVATWNIQSAPAKAAAQGELRGWLQAKRGVDVIVVGLQECQSDEWIDKVTKEIVPFFFHKIVAKQSVKLAIAVFVHSRHTDHVANVSISARKLAGFGKAGTKGVLAARFTLYAKRFLFINCHFDANLKSSGKRDMNFQMVLDEMSIAPPKQYTMADAFQEEPVLSSVLKLTEKGAPYSQAVGDEVPASPRAERADSPTPGGARGSPKHMTLPQSSIGNHDYIVWFGDLNYRVSAPIAVVEEAIARKQYDVILQHDELSNSIIGKKGFHMFKEAEITFPPTYKYYKGDMNFNTSKRSGVRRTPSYCDRILFCCNPSDNPAQFLERRSNLITPFKYKMYHKQDAYKLSDHRPLAWVAGVAVYIPQPDVLTRTSDLVLTGKDSSSIAHLLSNDLSLPLDMEERVLYKPIVPPSCDIVGDGYVYSSDDDDDGGVETLDYLAWKTMQQRVAALERDVRSEFFKFRAGVLQVMRGATDSEEAVDALSRVNAQRRVDIAWELLGEMNECGHQYLDRCDAKTASHRSELHRQRAERRRRRRAGEAPTIYAAPHDPSEDPPTTAPEMCDEISDGLASIASRLEAAMASAAGLAAPGGGATREPAGGGDGPAATDPLPACPREPVRERTAWHAGCIVARRRMRNGIVEEPEALRRLKARLRRLEDREGALKRREAAVESRTARLNAIHQRLEEQGLGREAEKAIVRGKGRELREGMLSEELKLLQHRVAMSREQLRVLQMSGRSEAVTTHRTATLAKQKQHVDDRALTCSLLQSHLERMHERKPSPKRAPYGAASRYVPFPGGGGGAVAVSPYRLHGRREVERSEIGSPMRARVRTPSPPGSSPVRTRGGSPPRSPPPAPKGRNARQQQQQQQPQRMWRYTGGGFNPPLATSPARQQAAGLGDVDEPTASQRRRERSRSYERELDLHAHTHNAGAYPYTHNIDDDDGYRTHRAPPPPPPISPFTDRPVYDDASPYEDGDYGGFDAADDDNDIGDTDYIDPMLSEPPTYFTRHPALQSPRSLHGAHARQKHLQPHEDDAPMQQDSFMSMLMMRDFE